MATYYPSLDEAFRANPTAIADWGYIKCSEADLVELGVKFFDDIEDPGACRRAAFVGQEGALLVLTIDNRSSTKAALFSSSARINNDADFVRIFPEEHAGLPQGFEVAYFGAPR